MFMTTRELADLLEKERPDLVPHRFWLANLLDRAYEAGRKAGKIDGEMAPLRLAAAKAVSGTAHTQLTSPIRKA